MTILKRNFSYFCAFLIVFASFIMFSCENPLSSDAKQKNILNEKTSSKNFNSSVGYESVENEEIVAAVQNYWENSLKGDKKNLSNYIRQSPEKFWQSCPSKRISSVDDNTNVSFSDGKSLRGQGMGISITEKENAFWQLEYFSDEIHRAKPELLEARVIESNIDEAIVKVDWREAHSDNPGISQIMALYKDNMGWKIFMFTDSLQLSRYNRIFATNDKCS